MFGINKNGTKHKIGIIMPAFFPASRVKYDANTTVEEKIDEVGAINTTTVTTGAGQYIEVRFVRCGHIVFVFIQSGTFTASAESALLTIPEGFRPQTGIYTDFLDTYSKKRVMFMPSGEFICKESVSSMPIRGTFSYYVD